MIYTDRSRWERGMQHCSRSRWLEYEAFETGIKPTAMSVALSTGTYVHEALAVLMQDCLENPGAMPGRENVRKALVPVLDAYRRACQEPFNELPIDFTEQHAYLMEEQACLIEGLVWVAYRKFLPWFTDNFRVEAVEREENFIAGCTCGAVGSVDPKEHEARGCEGVVIMARPDFVARSLTSNTVSVWDFKTGSFGLDIFNEDHRIQFSIGSLAVEARLGEPVAQTYTVGLIKGRREADRNDFSDEKLKKQRSILCYAYYKPADPPYTKMPEYRFEYTREKGFTRTPVWQIEQLQIPGQSKIETWVMDSLPEEEAEKLIEVSPPQQRPTFLMQSFVRQIVAYEKQRAAAQPKVSYNQLDEVEEKLDESFPQSWNCVPYKDSPCAFVPVCMRHPGWERPLEMVRSDGKPLYSLRVPHHPQEVK